MVSTTHREGMVSTTALLLPLLARAQAGGNGADGGLTLCLLYTSDAADE